jgi:hypothetical protein
MSTFKPGSTGTWSSGLSPAALFALHPINVESVVWVAERKNLLSMSFFLLALGVYRWYAREPRPGRYAVVALLFALGLMAKPQRDYAFSAASVAALQRGPDFQPGGTPQNPRGAEAPDSQWDLLTLG